MKQLKQKKHRGRDIGDPGETIRADLGMEPSSGPDPRLLRLAQLALLMAVATAFALAYLLSDGFRAEVGRVANILGTGDIEGLGDYILSFGAWAPVASLVLMIVQALAAPIPTFLIELANGLAFGVFWGWMLSVAGKTLAAGVCFWISRAVGRAPVEALVGRWGLEQADRWFARWGPHAVLLSRLVPGMTFDAFSYAAGLTRMRFRQFMLATVLGVLPETLVMAYLGQNAPQYVWALMALTVVVMGGGAAALYFRRRRKEGGDSREENNQ
ncbi:MAG: TVP38/TMEM64 family protein [Gammaproteobacteria bacterium]